MSEQLFERDLRAVLSDLAHIEVPVSLHATVTALPAERPSRMRSAFRLMAGNGSWLDRLASTAAAGVALTLLLVVGLIVAVSLAPPRATGPGAGARAFTWQTDVVTLAADALTIETGGRAFRPPAKAVVLSDPGSATYRTLELGWPEHGTEMRLNVYFAADASSWWVSEIRTYDGYTPGEWIYYRGPFFRTPRGESYRGDVSLSGSGPRGPGRLSVDSMQLTAFAPGTGRPAFSGCRMVGPVAANPLLPIAQPVNPDVSEFGVRVGMDATEAHSRLTGQGICHEFRLEFPAINFGQTWCTAPPGKVREVLFGSSGEMLLFVEDPAPRTNDPHMPRFVGC